MPATAKSVSDEKGPYGINKALFDQSVRIKDKMELIEKRLTKMDEHRNEVSESVYLRVKSDYEAQLDEVRLSFQEKCGEVEGELKSLYEEKAHHERELGKHQEVLEEAKFRHKLGEFTDKKYKDIELSENKEIKKYTEAIEKLSGSIGQYENILGHSFSPSSFSPAPTSTAIEVDSASPPTSQAKKTAKTGDENTSKTQSSGATISSETDKISSPPPPSDSGELGDRLDQELDSLLHSEGNYFEGIQIEDSVPKEPKKETAPDPIPETTGTKREIPFVSTTKPDDDSISNILRDIPLEEIPEEGEMRPSEEATGGNVKAKSEAEASLLVLEGSLDQAEYNLSENTSIGRSPSNDIVLKETKVSRQHATINYRDGSYYIMDLKSSNGVYVNGKKVEESLLKDGDEIKVGSFKFQFNTL